MRRRLIALGICAVVGSAVLVERASHADLENAVFTSKPDHVRLVVPRGWRATDQPSYPGLVLWMMRGQPDGRIVLTAESLTRELYCSWPVACRTSHDFPTMQARLACAARQKLQQQRLRVGPVQAGPRENEDAGLPSVWYEFDDGKHFMRQAVAIGEDRVYSLVLSADSADARSAHVRAFDQALRTLQPVVVEEPVAVALARAVPSDAGVDDAGAGMLADAAVVAPVPGTTSFESAPAPKINPIGPCTQQ